MKLMNKLIKLFSKEKFIANTIKSLKDSPEKNIIVQTMNGGANNAYVYTLFKQLCETGKLNQKMLYITGTTKESEESYLDIRTISDKDSKVCYFPDWDTVDYEHISPFQDIIHQRIQVLHRLIIDEPTLVIAPVKALMRHLVPKEIFRKEYVLLKLNEDTELKSLIRILVELGYERVDKVVEAGTFTVKGGILDIFPSAFENPARIEFWGDTVESIRLFDPITQKSIETDIDSVEILPQTELILADEYVLNAVEAIEKRFDKSYRDFTKVKKALYDKHHFQGVELYQPFFYHKSTLLEYFNENPVFVFDDKTNIDKFSSKIMFEAESMFNLSHKQKDVRPQPAELFSDLDDIIEQSKSYIDLTSLTRYETTTNEDNISETTNDTDDTYETNTEEMNTPNKDDATPSIPELSEDEDKIIINARTNTPHNFGGDYEYFEDFAKEQKDKAIVILSPYESQAQRIHSALYKLKPLLIINSKANPKQGDDNRLLEKNRLYIGVGNYSTGFGTENLLLIPDRELRGKKKSYSRKIRRVNSAPIDTFLDLKKGDYVVHVNYGIGKFIGIERMSIIDKERDFILIQYADEESLYVPIEQLNLVQKYIGATDKKVRLDKMGGRSWERRKSRVRRSVEEMAEELLKIYSARQKLKGFAFSKDTQYQMEFEAEFKYEETPDQMKAIEEVKKDMESDRPMDRLICGDVGYGKTEVAIRSAFKAVMSGKQVAVLVPTTILCEQHYLTFKERFKSFPVVIEMLSRFKTKTEQKQIIKNLKAGKVDIIVGTHRIISKDINFKNLGLVIVDEEQRFGVKHKERLKELRTLVDVISMSATPIPRTLHMSLTKIRDMSVINTPPENRLPIQTYTMEFNDTIIRDAILKELNRGGQVFFVYNRVKTIKSFAQYLMKTVPEADICVGHGQMEEKDLEKILMDFINKKYNVLISTTIIENGIDIPNVNTILIDRADRFGLSQLYQLRGRVGREERQAYCYLFYPADKALTEVAQKRLSIINEFTDLGSGFKIAMRDMEMRGAGNVLGEEQSGDIVSVGYEMYCKLLDEAIQKITTGEDSIVYEVYIDLKYDGYIPDEYIPDEKQKMEVYKRIAGCMSEDDVADLFYELKDRFGEPPRIVSELMKISELKAISNSLKIPRIQEKKVGNNLRTEYKEEWVEVEFNKFSLIDPLKILPLMKASKGIIFINPHTPNKLYLKICDFSLEKKVNYIKKTLEQLKRNAKV